MPSSQGSVTLRHSTFFGFSDSLSGSSRASLPCCQNRRFNFEQWWKWSFTWSENRKVWDCEAGGKCKIAALPAPSVSHSVSPEGFCRSTSKIILYMLAWSSCLDINSVIVGGGSVSKIMWDSGWLPKGCVGWRLWCWGGTDLVLIQLFPLPKAWARLFL